MITSSALQKELNIQLLPNQVLIIESPAKDKTITAGRGFGKSFSCAFYVLKKFLELLDELKKKKRDSIKIWIVAPSYELTTKVFNEFTKLLLKIDPTMKNNISGGKGRPYELRLDQNVWIQCKSTENPQSTLGERVDLMVVDEAPLISDHVYYQNILPPLAEGGEGIFIGTPRGKNWFYKKFINGEDGVSKFQFKSIDGRGNPEIIEKQREEWADERLFKQEYEAEFLEGAMQVFKQEDIEAVLKDPYSLYESYREGDNYIMGVDLAKSHDYTVISVVNTSTNRIVYWRMFNQINYPSQINQILAVRENYGGARIVLDTTGLGEPVKDMLEDRGAFVDDFLFSGKSKEALISKLRLFMANKWIACPDEKAIREQLEAFEFVLLNEKTREPLRNIQYGAPKGFHDDCVISLGLAVWKLNPGIPKIKNNILEAFKRRKPKIIQSDI